MSVSEPIAFRGVSGVALMCLICLDAVAAAALQMQEVFSSYRQSGDAASKRRVREAVNAALLNLPDWPR